MSKTLWLYVSFLYQPISPKGRILSNSASICNAVKPWFVKEFTFHISFKGPTAPFVDEYADNQDLWVEDFGLVFSKMLDNVYDNSGNKVALSSGKVYNYCDNNYQLGGKTGSCASQS